MCFGGSPQAPQIVYQGPSAEDLAASQASVDLYKQQMTDQQSAFKTQLQAQIDKANQETTDLQSKYASDAAAAAAAFSESLRASSASRSAHSAAARRATSRLRSCSATSICFCKLARCKRRAALSCLCCLLLAIGQL